MPCYRPLDAYIAPGKTENGKQKITFKRSEGYKDIKLPCGQCIGCKLIRSIHWAVRCEHEISYHDSNCFITLTYDDIHLPSDYSLNKWHMEKFWKKLRKAIAPKKIRYFMCGEYGDESWRPHYHAIIFGYDFPDKMRVQSQEVQNPYYLSEQLSELWHYGNHMIANATFETAAYVARYCTKKITGDLADEHYSREIIDFDELTGEVKSFIQTKLQPEFATMSRRPGIGQNWYNDFKTDCYPSSFLIHNGHKVAIPKYYDKLLEREDEAMLAQVKVAREIKALANKAETTSWRLRDREHCKLKQAESLSRSKI